MKRVNFILITLFCLVLAATLLIFFLGRPLTERRSIDYIAFSFLLFSQLAFFGALRSILSRRNDGVRIFLGAGVVVTLTAYLMVNALLTILIAPFYGGSLRHFVLIECLLLLVAALITVVFFVFSTRAQKS